MVIETSTQSVETGFPALFYTARQIEVGDVEAPTTILTTPQPTPTLTGVPSPTAEPVQLPTLTPDLNTEPAESKFPFSPLILGGGVAAVFLIGILTARELMGRRRE